MEEEPSLYGDGSVNMWAKCLTPCEVLSGGEAGTEQEVGLHVYEPRLAGRTVVLKLLDCYFCAMGPHSTWETRG